MANLNDLINETSIAFIEFILKWSDRHARQLEDIIEQLPDHPRVKKGTYEVISSEFVIVLLHITDRLAYQFIGEDGRNMLIDPLSYKCLAEISSRSNISPQ